MAVERIIGVDFGTSTSVIRVKRYENGEPVGDALETKGVTFGDNGAVVPTLILKSDDDGSITYYGYEAQQKKRRFTNYHSFKVDLESTNVAKRGHARKLTGEFLSYMADQYRLQSDGGHLGSLDDTERTIISYPVKWREETKQFMLDAAKKAGFPNVTGMDEAQAAIHAVTTQSDDYLKRHGLLRSGVPANILLIDMGAGTTDLVLCRHTPGMDSKTEFLSTWPKRGNVLFGGKEVDALLKSFFLDKMDEADAQRVFKRVGTDKFKSWKELSISPALRDHKSVTDFEALDNCVELMEIDMDEYCLNRAALEDCLKDYLKQLPILINGCLYDAGIKGSDVDLVVVTGGHSQWYFVQEMLSGKMTQYGNIDLPRIKENSKRLIPVSRPQETVALGLVYSPMHNAVAVPEPDPGPDQDSVIDSVLVPIDNPQIKDLVVKKRETEKNQRRTSDKKQKPTKNMKQGHQAGTRKVILGVVAVLLAFMVVDQLVSYFVSKKQDMEQAEWTASMQGHMKPMEPSVLSESEILSTEITQFPSLETKPEVSQNVEAEIVETYPSIEESIKAAIAESNIQIDDPKTDLGALPNDIPKPAENDIVKPVPETATQMTSVVAENTLTVTIYGEALTFKLKDAWVLSDSTISIKYQAYNPRGEHRYTLEFMFDGNWAEGTYYTYESMLDSDVRITFFEAHTTSDFYRSYRANAESGRPTGTFTIEQRSEDWRTYTGSFNVELVLYGTNTSIKIEDACFNFTLTE